MIKNDVRLGKDVQIFQPDLVNLYGCEIGDGTKIGAFVEIQKKAKVGRNCKISSHTFICEGVTIEDDCFIGHNVTFINDKYPRAVNTDRSLKTEKDWQCTDSVVKRGAAIGSGATIMCGVTIGENSMVGAGAVVVRDVPADMVVAGNPAKVVKSLK